MLACGLHAVHAAPAAASKNELLSEFFLPKTAPSSQSASGPKRYRVSGIIDFLEYDGPRATYEWVQISDWLKTSSINTIVREMNKYAKRAEPRGSIALEVPGANGAKQSVTIWQSRNAGQDSTPVEYFGQRYFEVEFEASGFAPRSVTFDCRLSENDTTIGGTDTICNSKESYPLGIFTAGGITNKIFFKLKSGSHRTINTMAQLYERVMALDTTAAPITFVKAAEQVVKDASGVWIQNLNVVEIDARASTPNYTYMPNGKMSFIAGNFSETNGIEPYGQVKIIPHATYVKVDDILTFLTAHPVAGLTIPDLPQKVKDIEIGLFTGKEAARNVFDVVYESDQRSVSKSGHHYYLDEWLPKPDSNLIVFSNVWEKDNGDLNRDDCLAKGYGLGFDRITVVAGGPLRGCKTDDNKNRLEISTQAPASPAKTHNTEWVLEAQLYFNLGDSGDNIEPYGNLYVDMTGVESTTSHRLVWRDDYRDSSGSEDLADNQKRFPRNIHFSADAGFLSSSNTLRFMGALYESDSGSGNDRYYDSSDTGRILSVPVSQLADGAQHQYELQRNANHNQKAYVILRLRKLYTVPTQSGRAQRTAKIKTATK
jgi:hypothetical protein